MRIILLFVIILLVRPGFSQDITVLDKILNIPIENVNFTLENIGKSTNKNGVVNISVFNKSDTVSISHLSYHTIKILATDIPAVVYLSPKTKLLPTVVLSSEKAATLSAQIVGEIKPKEKLIFPKTTTGILEGSLGITVQESQSGGGSPNFRGMEANRLLLVVDGIPLNNTIYRSGHLQAASTINPFFIKNVQLLSAPASVAYGNGAMGSALSFHTKSNFKKEKVVQLHQQYESASNAVLLNLLTNYHSKKATFTTGFSVKSIGNLKMGRNRLHGYKNWGNEPFAVKENEQLSTSYSQADFLHKTILSISQLKTLTFNTQYSISSDISRFDKLNDENEGTQKYADWYYGPQNRFFQSIVLNDKKSNFLLDNYAATFAFQNISESRHHKKTGESLFSNRFENVNIYDLILDCKKQIFDAELLYGVGGRWQKVISTANFSDSKNTYFNLSRYPDGGSTVIDYFAYSQLKLPLSKKLITLLGSRINHNHLEANWNNPIFNFDQVINRNATLIKSILLWYKATKKTKLKASYYRGFRNPNIDDIGKIFSKNDRDVVVPNSQLKPEYSNNIELGINYQSPKLKLQFQIFHTHIANAISRGYGSVNGIDSIVFDGELMRVQMNKNSSSARINGLNFYVRYNVSNHLTFVGNCNYLQGKENKNKPLAHIPPFNTKIALKYSYKKSDFEINGKYNGWKYAYEFDMEGVDNLQEATKDGTPMWYTINLLYKQQIDNTTTLSMGIKNIMDIHYKTFASGISASGRNLIVSLHSKF
jgi:hemoglobin/transferrin/lactoferrin receptor protein